MDRFLMVLEEALTRLMVVSAVPLGILNMFGGIVSSIWLAILGKWVLIGFGILLMISGGGLGLAIAPGLIFSVPAVAMLEKGNKIGGYFFGLLSTVYTVGVLTAWCILVLIFYTIHANATLLIPVLIWSYSVATGPISWLAQKDLRSGNENAGIITLFIYVAYILASLAILLVGFSLPNVLVIFGVVMSIGFIVLFSVAYLAKNSQAYY